MLSGLRSWKYLSSPCSTARGSGATLPLAYTSAPSPAWLAGVLVVVILLLKLLPSHRTAA
jgi:hypothetical protein